MVSITNLLVFAHKQEASAFLAIGGTKKFTLDKLNYYKLASSDYLLICGSDPKIIKDRLTHLIKAIQFENVINLGIAGAINDNFKIGEIFKIKQVLPLESNDSSSISGITLLTSSSPETNQNRVIELKKRGDLIDMEALHIKSFCNEHSLQFSCFKLVSDHLNIEEEGKKKIIKKTKSWSTNLHKFYLEGF